MSLAWIGVGNLATPIVRRLIAAGHQPVLHDIRPIEGLDATVAGSLEEAVGGADLVFSTLPSEAAFESVAAVVLGAMPSGAVYCDLSTVSPAASARVAALAGERAYVRAPVSGSVGHAEAGTLTVIASGPEAAYRRLLPVLERFSASRYHVGEGEEARVLKLMINNLLGGTAALLGESLALGEKAGLDWAMMLDVIGDSAAASPLLKFKVDPMKARDFNPAFTTNLMVKDLTLLIDTAEAAGSDVPMARRAVELLAEHAAAGYGEEDYFGLVQSSEAKAGLKC